LTGTKDSIATLFEGLDGLDALEEAQKHPNHEIYARANNILSTYFESADSMDDGSMAAQRNQNATQGVQGGTGGGMTHGF
jgi:hypothetical protein